MNLSSVFKVKPLLFAITLGIIDTLLLSTTKFISIGTLKYPFIFLVCILYGVQPLLFLNALGNESMSIMNLLWDVMSNIFVSLIGIYYFKETISNMKYLGIILSIISLTILSIEEK
jgi:multidrug transporter EmrE-like cation transporter